jgi:hypothetical protein
MAESWQRSGIEFIVKDSTRTGAAGVAGSMKGIEKEVLGVQGLLKKGFGIALGGVGVYAAVREIQSAARSVDELAKASDRLAMPTEDLSTLRYAAQAAGVDVDAFQGSLERLSNTVGEAARSAGPARTALAELGLDARKLAAATPQQMLYDLADAFAAVPSQVDRVRLAQDLFGRGNLEMINLLQRGAASMRDSQQEAEKLGLAISRLDAAKVEEARDAMARIAAIAGGVLKRGVIELAPYFEALATGLVDAATAGGGFGEIVTTAMESAAIAAAKVLDILLTIDNLKRVGGDVAYTRSFEREIGQQTRDVYEVQMQREGKNPWLAPLWKRRATASFPDRYDAIEKQIRQMYAPAFDPTQANQAAAPQNVKNVEDFYAGVRKRAAEANQRIAAQRFSLDYLQVPSPLGLPGPFVPRRALPRPVGPDIEQVKEISRVEDLIADMERQAQILQQTQAGVYRPKERLAFAEQAATAFGGEGGKEYEDAVRRYGAALDAVRYQEKAAEAREARTEVEAMDSALDRETEIIGRLSDSHDRAGRMVDYERKVRQAYADDLDAQGQKIDEYRQKLEDLQKAEFVNRQMDDLASTLTDVAMNFESAADAADQFLKSLARGTINEFIMQPATDALGVGLKSVLGITPAAPKVNAGTPGAGGVHQFHGGGLVGTDGVAVAVHHDGRSVGAASATRELPRGLVEAAMQNLRPDERLIVAQVGERIQSRAEVRRADRLASVLSYHEGGTVGGASAESVPASGGSVRPNVTVNFSNQTGTAMAEPEVSAEFSLDEYIVSVVLRDQQTGGPIRDRFGGRG